MRGLDLTWAGGEHSFLLTIELLRALQDKCDAGPPLVLKRLSANLWTVDDVIQPIRLGLEGGGMDKEEARRLVKKHVEDEPLQLSVMTAQAVMMAALYGMEDDPVGESEAGEAKPGRRRSRAKNGASPASTPGPAFSAATSAE
ncbi:gene transfer agent family protein [Chelativorans sp. ZYF759]|uniref:gene transfer agent family protein n=1 Tax=Chelativorans sp. ZYF759 TaxID=2692213 RepID=UPI00145EEA29|nr:gene transfer agent family protein [Chelativorans sp. ZYF759]NMG39883.1 gene transfer agent family protein [Chelativorans sp. ZYF759]